MDYLDQDFQANTSNQIQFTPGLREDWRITARWANFLAIVGFISIGIGALALIGMSTMLSTLSSMGMGNPGLEMMQSSFGSVFIVFLLLAMGVQVVITLFQFRFARNMKRALDATDQLAFEDAWMYFRNFFRWSGIMLIVVLTVYLLIGIAMLFFVGSVAGLGM